MYNEERKIEILNELKRNKSINVNIIAESLHVSPSTIRRDLSAMENDGLVTRCHGGAIINEDVNKEFDFNTKKTKDCQFKNAIAKKAASTVNDNDIVLLNSSTITTLMATYILARNVTVITNSLNIANIIKEKDNCKLIILGGMYLDHPETIEGPTTVNQIRNMRFNTAYLGANGIDIDSGITSISELEAVSKKVAINQSSYTYFLCENAKFTKVSLFKITDLNSDVNIITDSHIDKDILKNFQERCNIIIS